MATVYLRSTDGSDSDDGSTWALAKATLAGAFTAAGAGGLIYMSDNHAETGAAPLTLTSPGTAAAPVRVLCVDDSAEPPTALATTATVSTTGNNGITFNTGHTYIYGVTFQCGSGAVAPTINFSGLGHWVLESCGLSLVATAGVAVRVGSGQARVVWRNVTVTFGGTTQMIRPDGGSLEWVGGSIAGTIPTTLFQSFAGSAQIRVRGVDLSAAGAGKNLVSVAGSNVHDVVFQGCVLGASVTPVTGTFVGLNGGTVRLDRCVSGTLSATPLGLTSEASYAGTVASSLSRYRTGGADDGEQANAHSWEMAGSSTSLELVTPLESPPLSRWVDAGSQTVTVYVASGVTLQDDEFWVEVQSPSEAGSPTSQARLTSTRAGWLTSPANLTADGSSAWNGSGVGTKQKVEVAINPALPGFVVVRCFLAKASTTVYLDPSLDVAGDTTGWQRFTQGVQTHGDDPGGGGGGVAVLTGGGLVR
jgi:hypothetical protein